jgi:predicted membrane channel-forming protein YqfA (hemolysin III family)
MQFQKIEGQLAKICIISHIIENIYKYRRLDPLFYMSFIIGIFFYKNAIPRGINPKRGKYVLFHSIYHILVGIAGYSLAIQQE